MGLTWGNVKLATVSKQIATGATAMMSGLEVHVRHHHRLYLHQLDVLGVVSVLVVGKANNLASLVAALAIEVLQRLVSNVHRQRIARQMNVRHAELTTFFAQCW